ncbi:hypothetical protein QBC37DRAFT_398543 [Rhypophila decipiens]|uniref:Uncharacterized protein n=1 Tax=Rhypophila decipiens TaxID=261697 RepID=A0AAN6YA19_9PEZI|nr:hypothetical protein QBC37DRAFT_398543 [Rhypophila decipiens]
MSNQEEPVISPVPTTKTEDDVPDSVPTIAILMEYESMRYGNSLNAKAVIKHIRDVEVNSKEWYSGLYEKTLMEARGHLDKAKQALSAAQLYAEEWKKIKDLKKKGCKCFDEPTPGNAPTAAEVERFRFATGVAEAMAAVTSSTHNADNALEGGKARSAGATQVTFAITITIALAPALESTSPKSSLLFAINPRPANQCSYLTGELQDGLEPPKNSTRSRGYRRRYASLEPAAAPAAPAPTALTASAGLAAPAEPTAPAAPAAPAQLALPTKEEDYKNEGEEAAAEEEEAEKEVAAEEEVNEEETDKEDAAAEAAVTLLGMA